MHQMHNQDILSYGNKALELRDRLVDYPVDIRKENEAYF